MATISKVKNKHSYSYRARVRVAGHKPISKTFQKKSWAKNWASGIESKLKNNQSIPELEATNHTFYEVVEKYIFQVASKNKNSVKRKMSHLGVFKKHIGNIVLSNLTKQVLVDAIHAIGTEASRSGKPREPSTVNRYVSTLNHCLNHCCDQWEWIKENPLKKIDKAAESPGRTRYLKPDELELFLSCCLKVSKELHLMVLLAVSCGMRKSEILRISKHTFDQEKNWVVHEITKNGEVRKSYVYGSALIELKAFIKKRRLSAKQSILGGDENKNIQKMYRQFVKAKTMAGIKDFNFHDLRHTCASYLAMAGASLKDIAEVLGHKTIKMANRYSHLSETHVKEVVKNLAESVISHPEKQTTRKSL